MTIVARPQKPSNTAAAELLERYRPLIYSTAKKWARRDGMAIEDLVQEVSLALWQYHQEHPDAPGAHLKGVAHDAAREALRRGSSVDRPLSRKRLRIWKMVSLEVLMEDEAGWDAVEGSLIRRRRYGELPFPTEELALARVLYSELRDRLTPRQREVLALLLQRYTLAEVARALGLCPSRTHRLIQVIRCNLQLLCAAPLPPPPPDPEWATVKEAAEVLGLSRRSTTRLCREGKIPGARRVERPDRRGMQWLIPRPVGLSPKTEQPAQETVQGRFF